MLNEVNARSVKRYENMALALYLMLQTKHGAKSLSNGLGVSRATTNSYINSLMECAFIKESGRAKFVTTLHGSKLGLKCGCWEFEKMVKDGMEIAEARKIQYVTQLSFLKGGE